MFFLYIFRILKRIIPTSFFITCVINFHKLSSAFYSSVTYMLKFMSNEDFIYQTEHNTTSVTSKHTNNGSLIQAATFVTLKFGQLEPEFLSPAK